MSRADGHLPWAPRLFEGEAFGSWVGRLAGAYGMGVDEIASYAGVSLGLEGDCSNWLALPTPSSNDVQRLAALCRLPIFQLQTTFGSSRETRVGRFTYCHRCLYLNPLDVTAPYWHARWLASSASDWCATHDRRYEYTRASALRQHRNMKRLLRFISRDRIARQR